MYSNRWAPTEYLPGFLQPPCMVRLSCILMGKQHASPQHAAAETQVVHFPPRLLLIKHNFMAGLQKKVLPGKDWLLHVFPRFHPAACASLLNKKLTAASYNRLKCSLCTGQHGLEQERWAACMATGTTQHTKYPSHAQPSSPPRLGTVEI